MTSGITLLDEAVVRRVLSEILDARLGPILAAIERATRPVHGSELLTRDQLAAYLKVDQRTLRRLEREGALPRPARIGGRIDRWLQVDVDRWLESGAPALPLRKRAGSVSANRRSP
jgi:predicted DNA-binding transcriptional regulator AlpA